MKRRCTVEGCPNPHNAKGYCMTHYRRFRLYGDPLGKFPRPDPNCSVPGCTKRRELRGLCQMHAWRLKHYGDVNHYRYQKHCNVQGCTRPHSKYGLCDLHHGRLKRSGSTDVPLPKPLHPKRYKLRKFPGHPLAATRDRALLHRVVLYDAIGPGSHPCHWCGMLVTWDHSYPEHADALIVDHLDFDRHNNDPSNLAPSCNSCNTKHRKG